MLISVIIPVYNGEKHIEQSINNIMKQTYKNIEIIVINDGSSDNTFNILNMCQKKFKNVKIINKSNTGVSDSRNIGIKEANGEYILFLDSDDYLEETAIEEIVTYINKDVDLLIFGFKVIGDQKRKNDTQILQTFSNPVDNIILLKNIIATKNNIYGYIWRACYSSDLLKKYEIMFRKNIKISEDFLFLVQAIWNSEKTVIIPKEYYIYNINECSMTTKYIPTLLNDMNTVNEEIYNNIIINNQELKHGYYCCCANTYLRFVQNVLKDKENNIKSQLINIKKVRKEFKSILKKIYLFKDFNFKDSVQLFFLKNNLLLYVYVALFKLKRIIN